MSGSMERNLELYRRLQRITGALFWLPTWVLYLIDRFGLGDALRLQAVYYLAVVAFEVPSGWFSDRIGRVLTLRLAALWWVAAYTVFVTSDGFAGVAAAQILLAMGFAFISGTDVTLHYDSLEALGRTAEFEERESRVRRDHLLVTAAATVTGGALGMIDLRLPFLASLVTSTFQLVVVFGLVEPTGEPHTTSAGRELLRVVGYLRTRMLAWVMVYVLGEVVTIHLTSELAAPYLAGVLGEALDEIDRAPFVNGLLAAVIALVAAAAVQGVGRVRHRFGVVAVLVTVAALPVVTLTAMALATSVLVLPLIMLRSVQGAVVAVLVPVSVAPRVDRRHRATFLSLTSLVGRLGYGSLLLALGTIGDIGETIEWAAAVAAVVFVTVAISGRFVADD
jgi:hypothetical protein